MAPSVWPHRALSPTLIPAQHALLALALGGFGVGTGEFVTLGLLPNMATSLHVSVPRGGELISAYALGVVVGAPLLTGATAWLPRKGLLISIALTMAVGNFASAVMPRPVKDRNERLSMIQTAEYVIGSDVRAATARVES